jgi:ABC-type branched-subunit amino acid transport system substrate-binding protein
MLTPRRTKLMVLAALLAGATACGSTVQTQGSALSGGDGSGLGGDGLSVPGATTASTPGADLGAVGASTPGSLPSTQGATDAAASAAATAARVRAASSSVEVGFFITKGVDKLFASLGASGLSPGDQERQVNALVRVINADGGFAGKKIVPIIGIWNATAGNTTTQREAACAKWTQDHKVVAAVGESFETFRGCSNRHKLPMLFGNPFPFTQEEMNAVPYMATPTVPLDERMHPAWVDTLFAGGYFKPTGALPLKLGVVYADTGPQSRSVKKNLEPALTRHGIKVTTWAPMAMSSAGDLVASMQSTVLRFRAAGITHVMIVDTGGAGLLFMPQAESQGFRPRYGLHSWSKPAQIQGQVPAAQLHGAMGGGWNPTVDVDSGQRPKDNAAALRCLKLMHTAGESLDSSLARESAFMYCDSAFTLKAMADRAGSLDPGKMIGALKTLGPSYQVSGAPFADFTGRKDAPAGMRTFAFDDGCTCFRYTAAPVRHF